MAEEESITKEKYILKNCENWRNAAIFLKGNCTKKRAGPQESGPAPFRAGGIAHPVKHARTGSPLNGHSNPPLGLLLFCHDELSAFLKNSGMLTAFGRLSEKSVQTRQV